MNSYITLKKPSFCVVYTDVGKANNCSCIISIHHIHVVWAGAGRGSFESEFSEHKLLRPELIRASLKETELKGKKNETSN